MTDVNIVKVSELPAAGTLTGSETIPVVQDGVTKKATINSIAITVDLPDIVTPGTSTKVTYDSKGRITAGNGLMASDIPALDWSKITTGLPTTLAGYGITDAAAFNHTHVTTDITDLASYTGFDARYFTEAEVTALLAGKENTFSKGSLIQGSGVTLTGTLTDRLVGLGDITISAAGGGSGTVTSVAVADATGITWTGSPITTAGTLTPTLSANLQAWHALATSAKEDAFVKGTLAAGSGVKLTGTLTDRLVGTGTVTVEGTGAAIVSVTTTTYTLALTDANRFINAANASPITITIPQQSSVAWEDNTQIEFVQGGAGAVTIAAGAGVTLRRNSSLAAASAGQWAVFGLKRIALNEWVVFGQMGAA